MYKFWRVEQHGLVLEVLSASKEAAIKAWKKYYLSDGSGFIVNEAFLANEA